MLELVADVLLEHWEPEDGPLTEKRLMGLLEREGYEVAVYAYKAGTVFPEHEHAQEKCDAVVEGILRIAVGEMVYDLKPGDRLYLPAGTRHSAEVIGRKTVVSLDGTRW
jgi:quercetin dioxygenase-like cupin family protein